MATEEETSFQEEYPVLLSDIEDFKPQSLPSRTIDDVVGKLSIKDDETCKKKSFDRTEEEDLSLSEVTYARTCGQVHSDIPKANKQISTDTVLEHSLKPRDENIMAPENEKSNQKEHVSLLTDTEDVEMQSLPSRTIDNVDGKLSIKDNETCHKQSFDGTDEEDLTLSDVEYVRTCGQVHSDIPKAKKQISTDTVLEHSLKSLDENILATESETSDQIQFSSFTDRENVAMVCEPSTVVDEISYYQIPPDEFESTMEKWEQCKKDQKLRKKTKKASGYDDGVSDYDDHHDDVDDDDDDDYTYDILNIYAQMSYPSQSRDEIVFEFLTRITNEEDLLEQEDIRKTLEDKNTDQTELINAIFKDYSEEMVLKTFHQLIHKGKNLNTLGVGTYGQSILHKAVEKNFLSVVEKLLEFDFHPLCFDGNFFTPLHIAILKRYDEMAALIISKLDKCLVRRLFGDKQSRAKKSRGKSRVFKSTSPKTATDLRHYRIETYDEGTVRPMFTIKLLIKYGFGQTLMQVLDSFMEEQEDGSYHVHIKLLDIDDQGLQRSEENFDFKGYTAFQTLATCGKKDALNHPAVQTFVEHKWKNWCRAHFLRRFFLYLLSLICWTYAAVSGVSAPDVHTYNTRLQHSRAFFEVIAYLFALAILFTEIPQILRQRWHYLTQAFNILELTSAILLVMVLPLRYINVTVHWYFYAFGYCLWGMRIFKYSMVFNDLGIYAEVIKRIIVQDFVQFSILFAVVNLIFSGTFILILKAEDNLNAHVETSSFQGTMYVGLRTLIEAAAIVEYSGTDGYRTAGTILILVYMFFTIVALLNILIAQVSETYNRTHGDCVKTVRANRAWTIAHAEINEWHKVPCRQLRVEDVIKHVDLNDIKKKESTLIEVISEKIVKIEKQQIKNDLEVHTVKTRLRDYSKSIESKVNALSEQQKEVLRLLKKTK